MGSGTLTPSVENRLPLKRMLVAGVLLTAFFMLIRFPYERLADRIVERVEARTGARISLGEISPGIVRAGPGLRAEAVRIMLPSGSRVDLDRVGLRPALAFTWLKGDPALALSVESVQGGVEGTLTLGESPGFRGRILDLALGELPPEVLGGPLEFDGRADADIDVARGERGYDGDLRFQARDGSVAHPQMPIALPYQSLDGDLALGGAAFATIRSLTLESPLASGTGKGSIGHAPRFDAAPLKLDIELLVSGAVRGSLNAQGVQVGRDGQLRMKIMGTPARPIVR